MQFIFILAVVFLSAALSDAVGLEGIFGAFLSGLILNRFIPRVSPLMNRIEFTGNALFIPYFLIGVGMLINVRLLFQGTHILWVVFCLVLFGTLGKAIAAYLAAGGVPYAPFGWAYDVRINQCTCSRSYCYGDGGQAFGDLSGCLSLW